MEKKKLKEMGNIDEKDLEALLDVKNVNKKSLKLILECLKKANTPRSYIQIQAYIEENKEYSERLPGTGAIGIISKKAGKITRTRIRGKGSAFINGYIIQED